MTTRNWTADELALLGTASDEAIAEQLARPVSAVKSMRRHQKRREKRLECQRARYAADPEKKRKRSRDAYHGKPGVRERQLDLKRQRRLQ